MKKAAPKQRNVKPLSPLKPVSITFTQEELALLSQLASIQADLTGRAISRSTILRALVRLAREKLTDQELYGAIAGELGAGRHWGNDAIGKQGRGRPKQFQKLYT